MVISPAKMVDFTNKNSDFTIKNGEFIEIYPTELFALKKTSTNDDKNATQNTDATIKYEELTWENDDGMVMSPRE